MSLISMIVICILVSAWDLGGVSFRQMFAKRRGGALSREPTCRGRTTRSVAVVLVISRSNSCPRTNRGRQETPIPCLTDRCLRVESASAKGRGTQGMVITVKGSNVG